LKHIRKFCDFDRVLHEIQNCSQNEVRFVGMHFKDDFLLKYLHVGVAIEFVDCIFDKDLHFHYASFIKTISFMYCIFNKGISWGDEDVSESLSSCEQDVRMIGCVFKGKVSFDGFQCKGNIFVKECRFLYKNDNSQEYGVTFCSASTRGSISFKDVIFMQGLNMNACKIGVGLELERVRFLNLNAGINLVASDSGISCQITGGYFECSNMDLSSMHVTSHLVLRQCERFRFKKTLVDSITDYEPIREIFYRNGVRLSENSIFFQKREDPSGNEYYGIISRHGYYALVDMEDEYVVIEGVHIKCDGKVDWSYIKAGVGILIENTTVSCQAFDGSSFDCSLLRFNCDTIDSKILDLSNGSCRKIEFIDTTLSIDGLIDFRHSKVDWILQYTDCKVEAQVVNYNGITVRGGLFLQHSSLRFLAKNKYFQRDIGEVDLDLSFCSFGKNLQFDDVTMTVAEGKSMTILINASSAQIGDSLYIDSVLFEGGIILFMLDNAKAAALRLRSIDRVMFSFTGFEFYGFSYIVGSKDGDKNGTWMDLVAHQYGASGDFLGGVYVQLEKIYRSRLCELEEADNIYYYGRCINRKYGWAKWKLSRRLSDTLLKYLLGYGVRSYRIILVALSFILFEGLMYHAVSMPHAVYWQCFLCSLIEFIPLSGLMHHIPQIFVNNSIVWVQWYMIAHQIAGAILTPLYIASIAGYFKRSRN